MHVPNADVALLAPRGAPAARWYDDTMVIATVAPIGWCHSLQCTSAHFHMPTGHAGLHALARWQVGPLTFVKEPCFCFCALTLHDVGAQDIKNSPVSHEPVVPFLLASAGAIADELDGMVYILTTMTCAINSQLRAPYTEPCTPLYTPFSYNCQGSAAALMAMGPTFATAFMSAE